MCNGTHCKYIGSYNYSYTCYLIFYSAFISSTKIQRTLDFFFDLLQILYAAATKGTQMVSASAAKLDPFFWVQPNFWPNFWIQTGRVGPQDPKTGPIRSD